MCMGATAFPSKEMWGSFDLGPLLYLRHLWYLIQSVSSGEWSFTNNVMGYIFKYVCAYLPFPPSNTM